MAFDVKKWLLEDMGFTEAEITEQGLVAKFESRAEKLAGGYARQSDYSKQMNELGKVKTDLEAKDAKLTEDMAEWSNMTAEERKKNGDLRAKIDAATADKFKLEQTVTRLAEELGKDPKEFLTGEVTPPPKPPTPEPVDLDPMRQQIGGVANYMLDLTAALPDIAAEHKRLTGKAFNQREFIAGIKEDLRTGNKKAELDPMKRWEAQNNIPTLRADYETAQREESLKNAREEGRRAGLTEAALPGGSPRPGEHSPVFRHTGTAGSVLKRPQPGDRLSGAVAALSTGRYRTPPAEPAAKT